MSIVEKLEQDIIAAMKGGDKFKVTVLRTLKSDLKNEHINKGTPLTDDVVIGVLSSSAKKRRDSIDQFRNAGRNDLVEKETAELAILTTYLPEQMSEADVRSAGCRGNRRDRGRLTAEGGAGHEGADAQSEGQGRRQDGQSAGFRNACKVV